MRTRIDLMDEIVKYKKFAKKLAVALADEIAYAPDEASEESIRQLVKALKELPVKEEFDRLNVLSFGELYKLLDVE